MKKKIYFFPNVRKFKTNFKRFKFQKSVYLNYKCSIDSINKEFLEEILIKNNYILCEKRLKQGLNIEIDVVDSFKNTTNKDLFDAYKIDIKNNLISITTLNQTGLYYSFLTLQTILQHSYFYECEILDYSEMKYRGFIEGYYGIPYTNEERIDLIKYTSSLKGNIYIYAPKDDPYHSLKWKQPYNSSDLLALKKVVDASNKYKCRFAWAIHPFMHECFSSSLYEKDLKKLLDKFNQLYEIGVRQFVISADDVDYKIKEASSGEFHKKILNDVANFLKEKKDCYELIFVPSAYCTLSSLFFHIDVKNYFEELCSDLDENVSIMWTGHDVFSKISTLDAKLFYSLSGRHPFFWLNWPVNDYTREHLLMGKAEVFDKYLFVEDEKLIGIVNNPMEEAEPSKIGIFQTLCYAWNYHDFDINLAYKQSFRSVESNQYKNLMKISSFLTNGKKYNGSYFKETPKLKRLIKLYFKNEKVYKPLLIKEFETTLTAIKEYMNYASNIKMKETISPWLNSLADNLKLAKKVLVLVKKDENSFQNLIHEYEKIKNQYSAPTFDAKQSKIVRKKIEVGTTVLKPFIESILGLSK